MRNLFLVVLAGILFISCTKSGNSNPLIGTWMQTRSIEQYTDPYNLKTSFDTLFTGSVTVQFVINGTYAVNKVTSGTYSVVNDSVFTMKPNNGQTPINYNFLISGNTLKTRRAGYNGEAIQVSSPDGEFRIAPVLYVFDEYVKQ